MLQWLNRKPGMMKNEAALGFTLIFMGDQIHEMKWKWYPRRWQRGTLSLRNIKGNFVVSLWKRKIKEIELEAQHYMQVTPGIGLDW